jgi:hypothetical protein
MSTTSSRYVVYEPLGWSNEQVRHLMMEQLHKKLAMIGVELPDDIAELVSKIDPVLAGG